MWRWFKQLAGIPSLHVKFIHQTFPSVYLVQSARSICSKQSGVCVFYFRLDPEQPLSSSKNCSSKNCLGLLQLFCNRFRITVREWCLKFDQLTLWHLSWCCFCHVCMGAEFEKEFWQHKERSYLEVILATWSAITMLTDCKKRSKYCCMDDRLLHYFVGPASDPPVIVLTLFVTISSVWATKDYEGMFDLYKVCHSRNIP